MSGRPRPVSDTIPMTPTTFCCSLIDGVADTRPRRIAAVRLDPGGQISDKKGIGWIKEDPIEAHRALITDLTAQAGSP